MPALVQSKNASLATTGTMTVDISTTGMEILHVYTQLGSAGSPATATADNNTYVLPYVPSGVSGGTTTYTVGPQSVSVFLSSGPGGPNSGVVATHKQYNVKGLEKVRVNLQNNNVAALPGQIDVFGA